MSEVNDPVGVPDIARADLVDHEGAVVVPDAVLTDDAGTDAPSELERRESVEEPAKVMRIGSMIKQLLEEVRAVALDEPARERLKEIYETSVKELGSAVSADLRAELQRVVIPFGGDNPSDAELRVAQAQLVGWLEGLFHGIQATMFAQQMAARSQMEDPRRQIGAGAPPAGGEGQGDDRPGTYL